MQTCLKNFRQTKKRRTRRSCAIEFLDGDFKLRWQLQTREAWVPPPADPSHTPRGVQDSGPPGYGCSRSAKHPGYTPGAGSRCRPAPAPVRKNHNSFSPLDSPPKGEMPRNFCSHERNTRYEALSYPQFRSQKLNLKENISKNLKLILYSIAYFMLKVNS